MRNTSKLRNHSLVPDVNPKNGLGLQEREVMMMITGPQPRLDYPTETLEMSNGCKVERYVIPEADRQRVLDELYPFAEQPSLDDMLVDLHTDRAFRVGDFIVTREGDGNFLVTPYYAEAGGTVLDWVKPDKCSIAGTLKDRSGVCIGTARR